uniref:Uncharacterized protein n=1 Tax=Timema poppense TaxID=170557 RepID=A0A7R9HFQ4_TIMPO|nr:unnamed protein product [Timema poppensis]
MAELWDPHPQYEFTAFGRQLHLLLERDSSFVAPDLQVTHVWHNYTTREHPGLKPDGSDRYDKVTRVVMTERVEEDDQDHDGEAYQKSLRVITYLSYIGELVNLFTSVTRRVMYKVCLEIIILGSLLVQDIHDPHHINEGCAGYNPKIEVPKSYEMCYMIPILGTHVLFDESESDGAAILNSRNSLGRLELLFRKEPMNSTEVDLRVYNSMPEETNAHQFRNEPFKSRTGSTYSRIIKPMFQDELGGLNKTKSDTIGAVSRTQSTGAGHTTDGREVFLRPESSDRIGYCPGAPSSVT